MKRIILLLVSLSLFSCMTLAQQKKYVSYTVKEGETVKSIAKKYQVTSKDLFQLNPDMEKNLKANTVIIVPAKNYGNADTKVPEVKVVISDKKSYTVLPKDTLYGISKMFGVTMDQLLAANPQIAEGLKPGMALIIPKTGEIFSNTKTNDSVTYELHTVVKDDTLYNLSNRFQVSQAELARLNPELSEGLKLGMVLRIRPLKNGANGKIEKVTENVKYVAGKSGSLVENFNASKEITVAFLLPYNLNNASDSERNENFGKSNSVLNVVTDFHLGATMAIDSLRKRGLNIKAKFIDSENSTSRLQSVLNRNELKNVDVVIGPLYFDNAVWLSKHIEAPVVVPFYSKNQADNSANNLVKAAPDDAMLQSELLSYLEKNYRGENIIVINDGKSVSQAKLWQVVNKLKTIPNVKNISVVKSEYGYISGGKFSEKLTKSANNWVLLVSEEMVTTASAINSLKALSDNYNITLIAFDKGKNFDSVDNNLLGKLNFMYPSLDFINVDDGNLNNFYKNFQEKNFAIPSKYALKGFDITYDALARIATKSTLEQGLNAGKSARFSTSFDYDRNLLGSFENHGIFIIQFDQSLTPVILE